MESLENRVFSVGELTADLKLVLETSFDDIWVEGELSTVTLPSSGHCYFSLKDTEAQLQGVMWRSRVSRLTFRPESGMLVRVRGRVSVYEPRGQYQIIADQMQPAGEGALQLAFEQMKQRLANEGLFDSIHKKTLPAFPRSIGIVTSPDGAALRDILSILDRRFPLVQVFLAPAPVQGAGSAEQIAEMIGRLNAISGDELPRIELLIVGRGGGSIEDLWSFNEEVVARAIFESAIPVISAVGHETDVTIADFVADVRAATPSMAAELAVPDREDLDTTIATMRSYLEKRMIATLREKQTHVDGLVRSFGFRRPVDRLERYIQQCDESVLRLTDLMKRNIAGHSHRIQLVSRTLEMLNPEMPLERGYALVEADNRRVTHASELKINQVVGLAFKDGKREATVTR